MSFGKDFHPDVAGLPVCARYDRVCTSTRVGRDATYVLYLYPPLTHYPMLSCVSEPAHKFILERILYLLAPWPLQPCDDPSRLDSDLISKYVYAIPNVPWCFLGIFIRGNLSAATGRWIRILQWIPSDIA